MMIHHADAIWLFMLLTGSALSAPQQGGAGKTDPSFLIERGRAGVVAVGMTVDELYRVVDQTAVHLVDLYEEGSFSPAVQIHLSGNAQVPSITADLNMLDCGTFKKWYLPRLVVRDGRFRTRQGLGVGSTFSEVRSLGLVTAGGMPVYDADVPNFARIRFVWREGECENCPAPPGNAQVIAIVVTEPGGHLRQRRCRELQP